MREVLIEKYLEQFQHKVFEGAGGIPGRETYVAPQLPRGRGRHAPDL
jgi:hypothetical protein